MAPRSKILQRQPVPGPSGDDERGRDALFGTSRDFPRVVELDLDQIDDNPDQPRKIFDEASIATLAASIERRGLLQPVLVQKKDDGRYMRVAGERRYRAHRLLGRQTIFATITSGDPAEIALLENLERADLDPIETAGGFSRLMELHGYTQREVGKIFAKTESEISRSLALLRLPSIVQQEYQFDYRHVAKSLLIELAEIPDEQNLLEMWEQVKAGASVKKLRQLKSDAKGEATPGLDSNPGKIVEPMKKLVAAATRLGKQFDALPDTPLDDDQRKSLAELRDKIDQLLAR
jgi:ParB family chromosome partitioning protein